jgi:minor extracellular serine protease Vpr
MNTKRLVCLLLAVLCLLGAASGAPPSGRYAVIMQDPPAAQQFSGPAGLRSMAALNYRQRIQSAQLTLRRDVEQRGMRVTGSVQVLMNAVFVQASKDQVAELRGMSGVQAVVPVRMLHRHLDKAVQLVNAPAAWTALGGTSNAGAGVKIAILDSGIDQNHPAFQDASLAMPPGFPHCQGKDCAYTNNKVIVARSYVSLLANGSQPNPALDSRPDDLSPADRIGHGTALGMVAAGNTNTGPSGTITGVAPKAWLGNYKVFGSPELNDYTGGDVIAQALEDALNDGMDIAVISSGGSALSGPLDQGQICGASGTDPCDFEATMVEKAISAGLTVVISAGNEASAGALPPTFNTISSPATTPSAISVGASTNSHTFTASVRTTGQTMPAIFGDGVVPASPFTAPLRDVATLDGTGNGCNALPSGSLSGTIALILRTPNNGCSFALKAGYAQLAGATGVIFVDVAGSTLFTPAGLTNISIPTILVGNSDGTSLKSLASANPGVRGTLDPTPFSVDLATFNTIASFSSRGPSISYLLKPELVGVGTNVYMATQRLDPLGEMYDPSGYTVQNGTSFSTPMVAGAVALVKQKNPGFNPAQLKSAIVNTTTQDITENNATASVIAVGSGKLNAGAAIQAILTADPATISFGLLDRQTSIPLTRQLSIHYAGAGPASVALSVVPRTTRSIPVLDKASLSFTPGQADQTVTLTLSGLPVAGIHEGAVTIEGGGSSIRVPYMFVVGDGVPYDVVELLGTGFDGLVGQGVPDGALAFKIVDRYGVGVTGVPVQFGVSRGGGRIITADKTTGTYGIAMAEAVLGSAPGNQRFVAQATGLNLTIPFDGYARRQPAISADGVVNAASFQAGPGIAPGSYITIFGTGMSDTIRSASSVALPLALDYVSVSFDVPAASLSLPGRIIFVSPNQVNVQVPWALRDQPTVLMKVNMGYNAGQVFTAQVSNYAPAVYVIQGSAAALDENGAAVNATNAARRGRTVQIFMNGLGPVDNQPETGEPAQSQTLSRTLATPTVTIAGLPAQVQFSGLAPGFPGLNQVNVVIPADAPTGAQPLQVTIGGVSSPIVNVPIQ